MGMVAEHAKWPKENDIIFSLSERAQKSEKEKGKDKVINATIGALMDDSGKLIAMDTVYKEFKNLPNQQIAAYASIGGQPEYQEAVKKICFQGNEPDAHIRVIASAGGSGAIKLAMYNYTEEGDTMLVSDWYWSPYGIIGEETGRKIANYTLFDEKGGFNFKSYSEKFTDILDKQNRIFTIINSPANNPTGYSLSDEEWDKVLDLAKEEAKDENKKIVFLVDVAYIDFAKNDEESRRFFKKFANLPSNVLTIVAFSMSKGFSAYGMRMGAAIGISSDYDIAEEFYYSLMHSCRATWSNCNRGAMEVLAAIVKDDEKYEAYKKEKDSYKDLLASRAKVFVEESEKCGLEILPYKDGFFVSIPCENSKEICEKLTEKDLYLVPLKMGLRFAVCAVTEEKCAKAPAMIKEVLDEMKK